MTCATGTAASIRWCCTTLVGGVGLDTGHGNPSVVWPYTVSGNYFDALGIQPYLGRFIHASEEHGPNSVPEIVFSYALWRSSFNADPAAVGRTVQINKHPFTIIGVAPENFRGTELFSRPICGLPLSMHPKLMIGIRSRSAATITPGR